MILDQEKITRIKRHLKARPKGLTISDISHSLKINRNSVAKYLEILLITGQVEMRMYGNAKVYYLSNRVPISSMLKFANELILVLDSDLRVVETNENFLTYFDEKKENLVGNPIRESKLKMMDVGTIERIARNAFDTGEVSEDLHLSRDNKTSHLHVKGIPSVFDDGSRGTTLIFEDITDKKEIEDRLKISEAKYRAIVEDQTEMVDRFDRDLKFIFVNNTFCQFFGIGKEEMVGRSMLDFIPVEDHARVKECILALSPEHPVGTLEHKVLRNDGSCRWHQWTNRCITDDEGNVLEFQGVGRDITDKKAAEQQLLTKDLAMASSRNGIGIADLSGEVTYVNRAFLTLFGYDDESEVIGKKIYDFSHSDPSAQADIRKVMKSLADEGGWSGEVECRRRDGTTYHALLTATIVRDKEGIPFSLMATFTDITEMKKAREELRLKDTAIASSINAIAIFDADYHLIYANEAFLKEFDCQFPEIRGESPDELLAGFDVVFPSYAEIDLAVRKEHSWSGEVLMKRKDGHRVYFSAMFRRNYDGKGMLLSLLTSFVNITDLKNVETALKSSRQKLAETIEFMPDPTFIVDRNHRVIAWNKSMEAITGVRRETVLGKKDFHDAFSFYGTERPILVEILDLPPHDLAKKYPNVRRFGDSIYVEAFIPSMNGGKGAYIWGKATSLIDSDGKTIGAIESIRDISAWKRARESLHQNGANERRAAKEEEARVSPG